MKHLRIEILAFLFSVSLVASAGCQAVRPGAAVRQNLPEAAARAELASSTARPSTPDAADELQPSLEAPADQVHLVEFVEPEKPSAPPLPEAKPISEKAVEELQPIPADQVVPPGEGGLTLEAIEAIALAHNPSILQASASAQKASGFRQQVGRYPNPNLGYTGQQLWDKGTAQHMAYLEQDFVTAHKLQRNQAVLDQEVQSLRWEVEAQRYRVLTDVRKRFYEALTAQRRQELAAEFQAVAREGVRVAEIRRQALEGSVPEVLQAEIQLNEVDLIYQRAEIAYNAAWNELVAFAGVPGLARQRLLGALRVESTPRDWELTYVQLAANNPALQAARSRVTRSINNLDRQEVQAIPNVMTFWNAGHDTQTNSHIFQIQAGFPLPIFNQNQGNISAAQAEYCRAAQEVRRIELDLKQKLALAAQQYDSAAVTVERYETQILPKAMETLKLSEKAYAAGEFNFLQVLIVRRTFFESNLLYNQALLELASAKWMIDGMLLEGGLNETPDTQFDDGLRGQTLSGQ